MIYIILFSTILICLNDSMMYSNITTISSSSTLLHIIVIIYTIVCSIYYYIKLKELYIKHNLYNNKYKYLFIFTTIITILGSLFIYTEDTTNISNIIHVSCSIIGCVSLYVYLSHLNYYLYMHNISQYKNLNRYFKSATYFLLLLIIVFTRINAYIEIIYTFIININIYYLKQ